VPQEQPRRARHDDHSDAGDHQPEHRRALGEHQTGQQHDQPRARHRARRHPSALPSIIDLAGSGEKVTTRLPRPTLNPLPSDCNDRSISSSRRRSSSDRPTGPSSHPGPEMPPEHPNSTADRAARTLSVTTL